MAEIFDYNTSILNPVLKIIIALLFVAIAFIYYDVRKRYGGNVKSLVTELFFFAIFVFIASTFRYFGDGIEFGFTKDYSMKWLQSTGFLMASFIYLLAGKRLLTLLGED